MATPLELGLEKTSCHPDLKSELYGPCWLRYWCFVIVFNQRNSAWKYIIAPNLLRLKTILLKDETTYEVPETKRWHVYFSNVDKHHLATNSARMTPATVLELFEAIGFVVCCWLASGPYMKLSWPLRNPWFSKVPSGSQKTGSIVPKGFRCL